MRQVVVDESSWMMGEPVRMRQVVLDEFIRMTQVMVDESVRMVMMMVDETMKRLDEDGAGGEG